MFVPYSVLLWARNFLHIILYAFILLLTNSNQIITDYHTRPHGLKSLWRTQTYTIEKLYFLLFIVHFKLYLLVCFLDFLQCCHSNRWKAHQGLSSTEFKLLNCAQELCIFFHCLHVQQHCIMRCFYWLFTNSLHI